MRLTPLRGQVWLCGLAHPIGPHPAVVLTINPISTRLSSATVVLVKGTAGPDDTHVPLGNEAGLTKYTESYVNCTDLLTIRWDRFRRQLGLLSGAEIRAVERRVREILGLD